jgi:3-isopropylmalate/(R)-2-methylmalate dehydratase large subunit
VDGATYKTLEFGGEGVSSVPVNERLTVANMAIEAGGKAGVFPADRATIAHLGKVRGDYTIVTPDQDAFYERELEYDLSQLDYMVAMPHSPGNGKPVEEVDVPVDQVYLGSCTNGRIEDLRIAAEILKGRKVNSELRMIVVPVSTRVYEQAMREGLLRTFMESGAFISGPTCGACLGGYMGILASGERCVSSTNRNFIGRMGHKDSEVYLASPAVVAASAVEGRIVTPEALD